MKLSWMVSALLLAGCAAHAPPDAVRQAADVDWDKAMTVTVKMTDFAYAPSHVPLRAGVPVHLVLVNDGSGLHDFSAPAFFAAASFRAGSMIPAKGRIGVEKGQSAAIELVPGPAGSYPLECTEFLHSMFGMMGTVEVSS